MTTRFTDEQSAANRLLVEKRYGTFQAGVDAMVRGWGVHHHDQQVWCDQAAYLVEQGLWTEAEARHGLEAAGVVLERPAVDHDAGIRDYYERCAAEGRDSGD